MLLSQYPKEYINSKRVIVPIVTLWYYRQVVGLGHTFRRRINYRKMSFMTVLMTVLMTCPQGCPGFEVPHHPQVLCFIIPTAGKHALTLLLNLPSPGLNIMTFCPNPQKTPLCILYICSDVECLNSCENTEESQLIPQKVTQRPSGPKTENPALTIPGQIKSTWTYQDRLKECPD